MSLSILSTVSGHTAGHWRGGDQIKQGPSLIRILIWETCGHRRLVDVLNLQGMLIVRLQNFIDLGKHFIFPLRQTVHILMNLLKRVRPFIIARKLFARHGTGRGVASMYQRWILIIITTWRFLIAHYI